jgi:hypothetical protein
MAYPQDATEAGTATRAAALFDGRATLRAARVPRRSLHVLATAVAAIALASPAVAWAGDSSKEGSRPASGSTGTVEKSKDPGPGKKRPPEDGGAETRAAWSS